MATLYKRGRSPYWQARLKVGRRVHRISTGTKNKEQAKKEADAAELRLNRECYDTHSLTLIAATERFLLEKDLSESSTRNYRNSMKRVHQILGDFPLGNCEASHIQDYIKMRKESGKDVALRRDLAFLSSLFNTSLYWEGGPNHNPLVQINKKGIKEARQRKQWFTEKQFNLLLDATTAHYQKVVLILLVETGLRPKELFNLRWSEIDMDNGLIQIGNLNPEDTKNREAKMIPLTEKARNILDNTPKGRSGFVVEDPRTGTPIRSMQKAFKACLRRAGLPDMRLYDLRHTFASWAMQRGVSDIVVQHWLGHKTPSMTRRYAHPSVDLLKQSAAKFSNTKRDTHREGDT